MKTPTAPAHLPVSRVVEAVRAYTGIRWGDATALRVKDIAAVKGRLHA